LQLEELYSFGARNFLFLTVPPTNRAPLIVQQGTQAISSITTDLADYNAQLRSTAAKLAKKHKDIGTSLVFDAAAVFNTLLDNAATFGFKNTTGYCDAYQNGTPSQTTQTLPCAPVDNYL
jgi:phospholipase/lecithinase/hemolysin